jgi:metal-responsive CopG/Arc/MetJ family transcriptional regulator
MATEMITLKLDDTFLKQIDDVVHAQGYQNRTEFIRNALREKVEEARLRQAMMEIAHLKGSLKNKGKNVDMEKVREEVFNKLYGKLK